MKLADIIHITTLMLPLVIIVLGEVFSIASFSNVSHTYVAAAMVMSYIKATSKTK